MLMKVVEERDSEIASLKNHIESRDAAESSHTHTVKNADKGKTIMQENLLKLSLCILSQYTKRIDNLRMLNGYQQPKFQQFGGKGNPKQYIAHFIVTCETAGTRGDLLVKQFIQTLRGNAFDWYTNLEPESIDSWEQLERVFLNCFYSTWCIIIMIELTNKRQQKGESVIDYINPWRALSLDCKNRLTELFVVKMCTQGRHWGLLYVL
ncbi:retrotransposon gag protein [Cucumis melo var. makuwa]|uniref:Retrotransposon gag protein n=1 Tax=Cucumis melo var. makuwa TaxID=1194695 RepID=A0A5D3DHH2_CUCMM|nr:retrotransposon gag protein [Cucumis melo var. makuwa]TYK22810.1 retrotransposon gag protein [Cucumis melo var. makuwa]